MGQRTVLLLLCLILGCWSLDARIKLLDDLLGPTSGYRKERTPVKDPTKPVLVSISITLQQIRALHDRHQSLDIMTFLRFLWTDEYLSWNEADYENVTRIHVSPKQIWVPDIVLYNSVDRHTPHKVMPDTNIQVWPAGNIKWSGPAMLKSFCKVRIAEFPFDIQRCTLKFGSWTYNGLELNVTYPEDGAVLSHYVENEEWELLEMPVSRNDVKYDCCDEPYPDVQYTVVMRRKPMFYLFNLLFPCVLLMVLGILAFCLPADSGEKVSLAITVLLAMSVYQMIIMEKIPRSSDEIPLLNRFFSAAVVLLCLTTMITVFGISVHFHGVHGVRAPRWLRVLVLYKLAKIVCLRTQTAQTTHPHQAQVNDVKDEFREEYRSDKVERGVDSPKTALICNTKVTSSRLTGQSSITAEKILEEIQEFTKSKAQGESIEAEWKLIAAVLDKIFLIIFLLLSGIVTAGIFYHVPFFRGLLH